MLMRSLASICVVIFALIVVWYLSAFVLNTPWAMDKAKRAGIEISSKELVLDTWSQEKPKLPAPHQVGVEIWKTTVEKKITSKRSLIFHSWITLSSTLVGFLIGTSLGILLAIGIVHNNAMNMSVMPWAIASQTIPILAIAPMIIAPIIPTEPQAGVIATKPEIIPEAAPSIEGFPLTKDSPNVHAKIAAQVANKVLAKGKVAPEVASRLEPALNPNQPIQRIAAPIKVIGNE